MGLNSLELLEKTLMAALPADRRPSEIEVLELASSLRAAFPVTDDEFGALIRRVHSRLAITMDLGTALIEADHAPWLAARRASIEPYYWERFRVWLGRIGWTPSVINTLDGVADEILDLAGNPAEPLPWRRRGLVVGDVQSGKTATYTALTCKAADAGYRLIILLTGTLESLRRQTQERLDEGFVGLDSSDVLQQAQIRLNRAVGVGLIDQRRAAGVFTSRSRDFSRQLMTQLGFRLDAFQEPVLVVLKKNKKILQNLEGWLQSYNMDQDGGISTPLLLIDDEADSASINTNDPNADPTAINERVRAILKLFRHASYVGYTATPFANVFIDPETEDDMLGDDLFPRDYIYTLEPPSNYIGPQKVFADPPELVRWNDDAEAYVPARHKNGHALDSLPASLLDALDSFLLVTAVRDLRGEGPSHRSMLVNVSRFTAVQDRVAQLMDSELRDIQRDIRNFSHLSVAECLAIPNLARLHEVWLKEHATCGFTWEEVQAGLHASTQPVAVRAVNQRTGAASLDYKANREQGLRVIAVGGNSLSRGLTLEGLTTSYFYRNSQMYDTLLQMGRWFGYRDGYSDLCRVWLSEEAFSWYVHITEASEELRDELKRMRRLQLTPKDFGLRVRAHPDSLIITARNKMRSARTIERGISLSLRGPETARLSSRRSTIDLNFRHTSSTLDNLRLEGMAPKESEWGNPIWRDVPKEVVAALISGFEAHPLNLVFQPEELASFLKRTSEPRLKLWDIVLPQGSVKKRISFGGAEVRPSERRIVLRPGSILVSGRRARVGSRGIEREGLSMDQYGAVQEANADVNVSDLAYREVRMKPLLLVHLLRGYTRTGESDEAKIPYLMDGPPLVALGLSFPEFDDHEVSAKVRYKVNPVAWEELVGSEEEDDVAGDDEVD